MELTLKEAKKVIEFIINNNFKLQDRGITPTAVNICGSAGCGKSEMVEQIAKSMDANFVKLNLAMITEPSDIIGFPLKEFYVCKHYEDHPQDDECQWVPAEVIDDFKKRGWTLTQECRMGYAEPLWIKCIDSSKPTILFLDDYSRR